jgi:hypothetical protein
VTEVPEKLVTFFQKLSIGFSASVAISRFWHPAGISTLFAANSIDALILGVVLWIINFNHSKLLAALNAILVHDVKSMAQTVTRC